MNSKFLNIENYSSSLFSKDGILFSKKESKISYPETGNEFCFQIEDSSFWFKHRNSCIIEAVKKYRPESAFFDIGGGNGFVAKGLEDQGISTVLVEPGYLGCLNARNRGLKNIICSTIENASLIDGSIEAIGLFDVVEHIENDVNFLKSINVLLKKDGIVFISVPSYKVLWSKEDVSAGHFRRYTLKKIEEKLKNTGFSIEYSTYIFSFLPIPIFLFRSIPGWFGLHKTSNNNDKQKSEHKLKNGLVQKLLNRILDFEITKIKKGTKLRFGGSCFIIAKKLS